MHLFYNGQLNCSHKPHFQLRLGNDAWERLLITNFTLAQALKKQWQQVQTTANLQPTTADGLKELLLLHLCWLRSVVITVCEHAIQGKCNLIIEMEIDCQSTKN